MKQSMLAVALVMFVFTTLDGELVKLSVPCLEITETDAVLSRLRITAQSSGFYILSRSWRRR